MSKQSEALRLAESLENLVRLHPATGDHRDDDVDAAAELRRHPQGNGGKMIVWRYVTDDFGNQVSVTQIYWPNSKYHSIIVQHLYK